MRRTVALAMLCASMCQNVYAASNSTEAIISKIANADSVIIATNLGRCNETDSTLIGTRCVIDLGKQKCKKFHNNCAEWPWIDGLFPQTIIKIYKKSDKNSLKRFMKSQIAPPPKGDLDGMFGCYSIEGAIIIYTNGEVDELQYDSTNSFLNGLRMNYEFWGNLLKRFKQENRNDSGC